jgi:hypothetical protein
MSRFLLFANGQFAGISRRFETVERSSISAPKPSIRWHRG